MPEAPLWLDVLKAVGAFGGFAGVILTLLYTNASTRAANRRQQAEEKLERDESLKVLQSGLWAALANLREMIDDELAWITQPHITSTWVPLLDFFELYRANLDKLGQLQRDQVLPLANIYYRYQERAGYIARLSGHPAEKPVIGVYAAFDFNVDPAHRQEVINNLDALRRPIAEAMRVLET